MLSLLGFLTICVFLGLILTRRLSVLLSLILVPVLFALIGGFGPKEIGEMVLSGISQVAPTGILLIFAVLYFSLMIDTGLFDPVIRGVISLAKGDPLKITLGTAILAMLVHLDGDGTATFMITVTALFPIYKKLGIKKLILPCIVALSVGVMHLVPWSGTVARALNVMKTDPAHLIIPILPSMIGGILWVLFVAFWLGKKERKRLGIVHLGYDHRQELSDGQKESRRPALFWFNAVLTIVLTAALIMSLAPPSALFIVGFAVAILVNYPIPGRTKEKNSGACGQCIFSFRHCFCGGGIFRYPYRNQNDRCHGFIDGFHYS